ncbi:hypothetical protein RJ639_028906 [Escallonia herrerae]|uniref:Alpha-mannosidase n=1 Tax=Escallonia herrerae TaxID=1293975 RepID=A0AA88XBE7_9ASTE|nr:hypothetical protein RJ639_028906 [Escallonia herrerae]
MEVVKLFFTLTGLFFIPVESKYIAYNTSQVPDKINVHLVPHSHDDVGWLKTVDQYYVGILRAVVETAERSPSGKSQGACQLCRNNLLVFSIIILQIFTGIFPRHYDPPDGFTFEINDESPPIQDDALLFDYNVQERVNNFVAAAIVQDGRINALYSTLSIYTNAKYAANEYWPLKAGDFFPRVLYADRENAYWTGYFTSRPAFKGYVRTMSAYYLAARQLEFFKGRSSSGPNTDALADALAISQHHDAVSGTQRQHVAADYAMRISMGYTEAEKMVASSLAFLTESRSSAGHCPLLNISYCPPSEAALSNGKSLVVVVYNPLGWKREEVVRIPVSSHAIIVLDSGGREIESQLLPLSNASLSTRSYHVKAYLGRSPSGSPNYWLAFSASVPPLGFSTYTVSSVKPTDASSTMSRVYTSEGSIDRTVEVGQGNLKLLYSADEGKLTHYVNSRSLVTASAEQSYSYYSGYNGTDRENQGSGAYVFRPNGTYPIGSKGQVAVTVLRGPVVDEVHKQLNPWIFQVTRVYKGKEHAEIEFNIGPIPVEDGVGKEITTQLTTALKSNKTFYTDSNGRDFIKRADKGNAILQVRDYRADWDVQLQQPIAGNYYPINLGIYLEDETMELSVLVDRAVGGSSLVDGQIELMLHRRLLRDDSRGVGEALNEEVCVLDECKGLMVQGKFYVRIDPLGEGSKWRRTFGQEIYSPLLLAFTEQDGNTWTSSHVPTFSAIEPSYSLPSNIAVLTLQELKGGKALLRLAHLYETGEDKDYSVMTSVELKKLFPNKKITKVTEMNLSANQERAEMEKKRLVWKVKGSSEEAMVTRGGPVDPGKLVVELAPMEIRTFFIDFDHLEKI